MKTKMGKTGKRWWIAGVILIAIIIILIIVLSEEVNQVSVAKAQLRNITSCVPASGRLSPTLRVNISPDVSGEVVELYVKEGDYVKKGDLLLRIKQDAYRSAVERTEAILRGAESSLAQVGLRFEKAKANYQRDSRLFEKKIISNEEFYESQMEYLIMEKEIENAMFNIESAKASLSEAKENLARTDVRSPMNGTVTSLCISKGERVVGTSQMAGTIMMEIADLERMELVCSVSQNDILRISVGDTANICVDAFGQMKFKGIVCSIASNAKKDFEVRIAIVSHENRFRPGMRADADIITEYADSVPALPIGAILFKRGEQEGQFVYIYDPASGRISERRVKTGLSDIDYIEIRDGVDIENEYVVTGPYSFLKGEIENGEKVKAKR
ncbi:MAG: efflux RND transporter periplasmic adaptor subunit [Candidatus Coprenecus sp.]|nr:efflux RND transporter periplasmic adaptor subunit [Candidatus Coprenecus sp.]